jgi:hypothetical protein
MVLTLWVSGFFALLTSLITLQVAAGLRVVEIAEQQRGTVVESLRG